MFEPAELLALGHGHAAGDLVGPGPAQVQPQVGRVQAQAGHQHRGHRHQRHRHAALRQPQPQHRALVAAEQPLHPRQRDRVHVPGVAAEVGDVFQRRVVRRMEAVVHRRGQAQRDVAAAFEHGRVLARAEQLVQAVREALGLEHATALHRAAGADDGVARAGEDGRVGVHRPRAGHERTREAVVQAREALLLRVAEVEVGEQPPDGNRQPRQQRAADLAEAPHRACERDARDAVGEQEVQVLLLEEAAQRAGFHDGVKHLG